MFFGKKKYRVRKYRKKKKCPFPQYEPEPRFEIHKEQAMPVFLRICDKFTFLGGFVSFFASTIIMSIKEFFGIEKRVREVFDGRGNYKVIKYEEYKAKS